MADKTNFPYCYSAFQIKCTPSTEIDAIKLFDGVPKSKIKEISYENAMQGAHGYRPDKDNYKLSSFPNQTFSGYKILAYYYVSFAIALPEFLPQLELPYHTEYEIAKSMNSPNR